MSGKLHKIADELGVVARNLDGSFILMDVRSLDHRPPQDQLWVVVDFDDNDDEASQMAISIGERFGVPIRTSLFVDMEEDFIDTMRISGAAYQIGERPPFAKLISKHPRLSRPKLHGWEIDVGWVGLVDQFFDVVDRVVPDDVGFDVVQIKEKFGGLRLHCRPVRQSEDAQTFFALDEISSGLSIRPQPRNQEEWEKELMSARILAEQRSFFVCERCGEPGHLRVRDGFYFTACDAHATQDGKIAEIVEGQSVIRIDGKRMKYDAEQDEMVEVERIFEEVEGLTDLEVRAIHRNLREQYELEDLTVLYAVKALRWGNAGAGYFVIVRLNDTKEIRLIETETWGQFSRPVEDALVAAIQEYRDLADKSEALLERHRKLRSIKDGKQ